jgi:hypothetical protein
MRGVTSGGSMAGAVMCGRIWVITMAKAPEPALACGRLRHPVGRLDINRRHCLAQGSRLAFELRTQRPAPDCGADRS